MSEVFAIADNLDLAWSNFDPFFTLPANCPYHVEREGKPLDRLKRALLRENRQLPKYFFSGHRGCGKSTELNRLHVEPDALNLAIRMGAGVFRETARIMQIAADSAIENEKKRITIQGVQRAVREIRSDFKRILKSDDYNTLNEVYKNNEIRGIEKIGHLLHNLSILEYVNDETWCDVHPTLEELAKS